MPKTQYIQQKENSQRLFMKRGDILSEFFEISDKARDGGMGDVFFCRDKRDNKFYVLKTFNDIALSEQFKEEVLFSLSILDRETCMEVSSSFYSENNLQKLFTLTFHFEHMYDSSSLS